MAPAATFAQSVRLLAVGTPAERPWTNALLVFVPLAVASASAGWGDAPTFLLTLAALIPLAERLGFCTEALAEYTSDTFAGLMNATMGNAPELIIAIFAIRSGQVSVVQQSLLGSVLSNLLFVLGTSFFVGGCGRSTQRFSTANSTNSFVLLLCAAAAHALCGQVAAAAGPDCAGRVLRLSRGFAVILCVLYGLFLVFQLRTHKELFDDDESEEEGAGGGAAAAVVAEPYRDSASDSSDAPLTSAGATATAADGAAPLAGAGAGESATLVGAGVGLELADGAAAAAAAPAASAAGDDGGSDEPRLSFVGSLVGLACVTAVVAYLSELLTASIMGGAAQLNISAGFVTTILTPIAGNAAEHWSAVFFARKNRLNVSIGITVGSAVQIALFLVPASTLIGWGAGVAVTYDYGAFETWALLLAVLLGGLSIISGKSTWMLGVALLFCYLCVAAGFFVIPGAGDRRGACA